MRLSLPDGHLISSLSHMSKSGQAVDDPECLGITCWDDVSRPICELV